MPSSKFASLGPSKMGGSTGNPDPGFQLPRAQLWVEIACEFAFFFFLLKGPFQRVISLNKRSPPRDKFTFPL